MNFIGKCLILGSLLSLNNAKSHVKRYAIPVGGSISLECVSDYPAIWMQNKNGDMKSLASGRRVLPEVPKERFIAASKGKLYVLTLKNAILEDSSEIVCDNKNHFHINVVPNPICSKLDDKISEDEQVDITCELDLHSETDKSRLSWKLSDDKVYETLDQKKGTFKYTANYLDHGKPLKCVVHADHWDQNIPKPSCSYGKLVIQFVPRIQCKSHVLIPSGQSETSISCKIVANPLPPLKSVAWKKVGTSNDHQKLNSKTSIQNGEIVSIVKVNRHHVSRQKPSIELKISTKNPLFNQKETSTSDDLVKSVQVDMVLGPEIACPSRKRLNKEDDLVNCDVYVNPLPPTANISWNYGEGREEAGGGRNFARQSKEMISKIQGGIRVEFPIKTIKNEFDHNNQMNSVKMTLKVSGPTHTASKDISILWGSYSDDSGFYDEDQRHDVLRFSGVAVLIAFLLSLLMLTATVCVALYKKGYLCLKEEKLSYEKENNMNLVEEVSGEIERERERENEDMEKEFI